MVMAHDLKQLTPAAVEITARVAEIGQRVQEIDDGPVKPLDWHDVRAELFADE